MGNLATDILSIFVIFGGLILPLLGWVWIAYCKYIRHFRKECNNCRCWYRCKKCPPLHSEQLKRRIALLEQKYPSGNGYITMLKGQLQVYLDNPTLDRETESQMMHRLVKEARERNG